MTCWAGIGRSEIGLVRAANQDAFITIDPLGLWAVADGIGDHVGGEVAAQLAIASIKAHAELSAATLRQGHTTSSQFLTELITHAHLVLMEQGQLEPTLKGMGTTLVMLLIHSSDQSEAHVAHLGDSRAYRFRSGALTPLTRDHTLIEKYLARGILTEKTARTHPERHVLTQALGLSAPLRPSLSSVSLEKEDLLLLCSDGLTKMLEDDDIRDIMRGAKGDPIQACDHLIDASLERGGTDNVTVVVIGHP